jgi:hypothetical protein
MMASIPVSDIRVMLPRAGLRMSESKHWQRFDLRLALDPTFAEGKPWIDWSECDIHHSRFRNWRVVFEPIDTFIWREEQDHAQTDDRRPGLIGYGYDDGRRRRA